MNEQTYRSWLSFCTHQSARGILTILPSYSPSTSVHIYKVFTTRIQYPDCQAGSPQHLLLCSNLKGVLEIVVYLLELVWFYLLRLVIDRIKSVRLIFIVYVLIPSSNIKIQENKFPNRCFSLVFSPLPIPTIWRRTQTTRPPTHLQDHLTSAYTCRYPIQDYVSTCCLSPQLKTIHCCYIFHIWATILSPSNEIFWIVKGNVGRTYSTRGS